MSLTKKKQKTITAHPDWARLPCHLLDLILEKLESFKDILQFYGVCVSWNSIVKHNKTKCLMKTSHQVPMLLVPNRNQYTWDMYDPMTNKFKEISKLHIPYDKRFGGSSQGWLLTVNRDFTVTLYKPYSTDHDSAIINLPCLFPPEVEDGDLEGLEDMREYCDQHIYKATITADPLINPNDYMVVVIYLYCWKIATISPGRDNIWRKIDPNEEIFSDILFNSNKFYFLNHNHDTLSSYDSREPYCGTKVTWNHSDNWFGIKSYIVKSFEGDILQVLRRCEWNDSFTIRRTTTVNIFKLDFVDGGVKRVIVKSLGDVALFLGDNSSIYVRASNFLGCKSNCIYFSHDTDLISYGPQGFPCDCGIYNLEDNSYKKFTLLLDDEDSTIISKMEAQPPIWIQPTLNL
ncbi:hypothetical protein G4B88_023622 [Cannabis sativa]|uniref:KIB1-4 beta-propeller domain-containing protein n=1 Tax=Cannabis sativa TaxID=3483 RepID=A0A7J6HWF7_CANSA|nr:hypothetical protein G4B88_023622 [Cannabis sativa]